MSALNEVLAAAARHPWYPTPGGARLADWLVMTKAALGARLSATRADGGGIYYSRSGGTTSGRPVYMPADVAENHEQRRRLARRLAADGVLSPRTVALNVCPMVRLYRTLEIVDEFCEHCGATVLPASSAADDGEVYELAARFAANTLVGLPSRLLAFARYVRENRLHCPVDAVIFGGEPLHAGKRRFLHDVLGVRRFSGVYGSAELGVIAWQPDVAAAPVYHFPRDLVHVEIVGPGADGFGALVATNLVRRRFPLVRYQTGDVGRVVAEGSETVSFELRGRENDSFLVGDDFHVLEDFADLFRDFEESQVQLRFDEARHKDVVRFCLNPGGRRVGPAEEAAVAGRINDRLGNREGRYATEVAFVGPEALVRSRENLKTPAVVDLRGR